MDIKNLKDWEKEVIDYLSSINEILKTDINATEKYYGFDVIDGQLKSNPEILFIGINPGSGSGERHHKVKFSSSNRISYLDYFSEDYNYALARETISLLRLLNLTDEQIVSKLENDFVKTNFYHIITKNENDIKATFTNSSFSFDTYFQKSAFFCIELIKLLNPKIVVFEGKSAYNNIVEQCFEEKNTWNNEQNFGYFYFSEINTHFIGYSRTFSNINSKENIAKILKLKLEN